MDSQTEQNKRKTEAIGADECESGSGHQEKKPRMETGSQLLAQRAAEAALAWAQRQSDFDRWIQDTFSLRDD